MYIATLADVRTECSLGLGVVSDDNLQTLCERLEAQIEHWTGHWFESRERTYRFVISRDTGQINFPAPVISLTSMTIDGVESDLDYYIVPDMEDDPDGRRYPRIIASESQYNFDKDELVIITGNFGFVESDESVPVLIQELLFGLVRRKWRLQNAGNPGQANRAEHVKSLSVAGQSTTFKTTEPTGDPELDEIIATYRRIPQMEVA